MKAGTKPAWIKLLTDAGIIAALLIGAVYVLSVEAGASEKPVINEAAAAQAPTTASNPTQ